MSQSLFQIFFFPPPMATPTAYGNSKVRDYIQKSAANYAVAAAMGRSFNPLHSIMPPLCWARDQTGTSAATQASAVGFLTLCSMAETPLDLQ